MHPTKVIKQGSMMYSQCLLVLPGWGSLPAPCTLQLPFQSAAWPAEWREARLPFPVPASSSQSPRPREEAGAPCFPNKAVSDIDMTQALLNICFALGTPRRRQQPLILLRTMLQEGGGHAAFSRYTVFSRHISALYMWSRITNLPPPIDPGPPRKNNCDRAEATTPSSHSPHNFGWSHGTNSLTSMTATLLPAVYQLSARERRTQTVVGCAMHGRRERWPRVTDKSITQPRPRVCLVTQFSEV